MVPNISPAEVEKSWKFVGGQERRFWLILVEISQNRLVSKNRYLTPRRPEIEIPSGRTLLKTSCSISRHIPGLTRVIPRPYEIGTNFGCRSRGEAILADFGRNQPKPLGVQKSIFDPQATRNRNSIGRAPLQTSFSISCHIPGLPRITPGSINCERFSVVSSKILEIASPGLLQPKFPPISEGPG